DRRHGRQPSVPDGARVIFAKVPDQSRQPRVGHAGDMRGGMSGIDAHEPATLEQRHPAAGAPQQIRGGNARDTAANDDDVDAMIAVECLETRHVRVVLPVRRRVEFSHISFEAPRCDLMTARGGPSGLIFTDSRAAYGPEFAPGFGRRSIYGWKEYG